MKAITKFLNELDNISGNMERYHQKSDYWPFLTDLRKKAVNASFMLSEQQIKFVMNRINEISERFNKFWPIHKEYHKRARENEFTIDEFGINIYWLLGEPDKPILKGKTDVLKYLTYWSNAIMIKQSELNFFINSVERNFNGVQVANSINEKYIKFWKQFENINRKTNLPYLAKEDVGIFLNQAFGKEPLKKTFNPEIDKKELCHAAWLFYRSNRSNFKKPQIAQIMKDNFPEHFPDELDKETKNIRDGLDYNKRVFCNL